MFVGYHGSRCHLIDGCYGGDRCSGRGVCTPEVGSSGGYACDCRTHFRGQYCHLVANACESNPCSNSAYCFQRVVNGSLSRLLGHPGASDSDLDVADPKEVTGRYATSAAPDSARADRVEVACVCLPGYDGVLCRVDVDECLSSPCGNGAVCSESRPPPGFACTCTAGYSGPLCETDINECSSQPCRAGEGDSREGGESSCLDLVDGFECVCSSGFEGRTCERDARGCLSMPCKNNGTCIQLKTVSPTSATNTPTVSTLSPRIRVTMTTSTSIRKEILNSNFKKTTSKFDFYTTSVSSENGIPVSNTGDF